eukprot:4513346-Lingulodinium_polyedra.AAC.1
MESTLRAVGLQRRADLRRGRRADDVPLGRVAVDDDGVVPFGFAGWAHGGRALVFNRGQGA